MGALLSAPKILVGWATLMHLVPPLILPVSLLILAVLWSINSQQN